jgi:hypothetical protein
MAATTSGALKAWLEGGDLGLPFFRDRAPKDQGLPFGVITEAIAITPVRTGDFGDQTAERVVDEMAQVSVYEVWRTADGRPAEDYERPGKVYKRLHGAVLSTPKPGVVKVTGERRTPDVAGPQADTSGLAAVQSGADGSNVVASHFTVMIRRTR